MITEDQLEQLALGWFRDQKNQRGQRIKGVEVT
jgi:hypothetical protein